jgi:hypothetical protein
MQFAVTMPRVVCAFAIATLVLTSARPADAVRATRAATGCKMNYAYAGAQDVTPRSGIRARVTNVTTPRVAIGHVAGWLGVGGPGLGPNGTDEWLQAGFVALENGPQQIYYELTLPKTPTSYHPIKTAVDTRETHLLTVLEMKGKLGAWRVWLDNVPVSPAVTLPRSHDRFVPQAIAETWNAGTRQCNDYRYSFTQIQIARAPGGAWGSGKPGYLWRDPNNQLVRLGKHGFEARSTTAYTAAARTEPLLLGPLASRLAGRKLTAECVKQRVPVHERPSTHLLLSNAVCEWLIGYAVAQPRVPAADSRPGFLIAATALGFLRGVARAARTRQARIDCRAVGWLYGALRTLGATRSQALSLRRVLLQRRTRLQPKLSLHPGCRFR